MNLGRFARIGLVAVVLPLAILALAVQLWMYRATSVPGVAPRPAIGLQDIQTVSDLQAHFNQDAGKVRLVVLISPT